MIRYLFLFLLIITSTNYSQDIINISISKEGSELLAPSYNYDGSVYISLKHLSNAVNAGYNYDRNSGKIVIVFSEP